MAGPKLGTLKTLALILSLYLGFWILMGLVLGDLVGPKASVSSLLLDAILDSILVLLLLGTIKHIYLITYPEMGITYRLPRLNLLVGLAMGGALWLGAGAVSDATKHVVPRWAMVPLEYDFVAIYANSHGVSKAILLLVLGFATPVIEEVFFRGLIYSVLQRGFSEVATLVLSSIVFGLWHVYPILILSTFLIGCGLALLRQWGKSLLGPIVAHMTINCLSLTFHG